MDRKREDDNLTIDRIKNRDERELRWGIGVLIALADVIVVNEGSLDEFREKVINIILG